MASSDDRLIAAVQAAIRSSLPPLAFLAVHEYRVLSGTAATGFVLEPADGQMPTLAGVQFWNAGTPSGVTAFVPGRSVLIGFVGGDPARPYIAADGAVVRHGDALAGVTVGAYVVAKAVLP